MRRLYRSRKDRKIAGVCGGLAEYFHIDSAFIRLAYLFFTIITGMVPGLLCYILGWFIIPQKR